MKKLLPPGLTASKFTRALAAFRELACVRQPGVIVVGCSKGAAAFAVTSPGYLGYLAVISEMTVVRFPG